MQFIQTLLFHIRHSNISFFNLCILEDWILLNDFLHAVRTRLLTTIAFLKSSVIGTNIYITCCNSSNAFLNGHHYETNKDFLENPLLNLSHFGFRLCRRGGYWWNNLCNGFVRGYKPWWEIRPGSVYNEWECICLRNPNESLSSAFLACPGNF